MVARRYSLGVFFILLVFCLSLIFPLFSVLVGGGEREEVQGGGAQLSFVLRVVLQTPNIASWGFGRGGQG